MQFSEKLKSARLSKKMTQKELASKAGIGISTIKQYELGYRKPKIENLEKISKALDIPLLDLYDLGIKEFKAIISNKLENSTLDKLASYLYVELGINIIPIGDKKYMIDFSELDSSISTFEPPKDQVLVSENYLLELKSKIDNTLLNEMNLLVESTKEFNQLIDNPVFDHLHQEKNDFPSEDEKIMLDFLKSYTSKYWKGILKDK